MSAARSGTQCRAARDGKSRPLLSGVARCDACGPRTRYAAPLNDVVLRSCIAPDTVRLAGEALVLAPNRYAVAASLPVFRYEPVPR